MPIAPTDEALHELAEIAGIAPANHSTFAENVRARVRDAWFLHYTFIDNGVEISEGIASALATLETSARQLLAAAREVVVSMGALADAGKDFYRLAQSTDWQVRRRFLDMYIAEARSRTAAEIAIQPKGDNAEARSQAAAEIAIQPKGDKSEQQRFMDAVLFLAALESPPGPHVPELESRGQGRPPEARTDGRRLLVLGLLDDVDKAGGRLSFNTARETNGTRALRVLAPYLPKGFVVLPRDGAAASYKEWNARKKPKGKTATPR